MGGACSINRDCKIRPIRAFNKEHPDAIYYVGIAVDEPERLERARGKGQVSLLAKYGYTEQMALELCKEYGLLSPSYDHSKRGGCWFCPNARKSGVRFLYDNHRDLFDHVLALEQDPNTVQSVWMDHGRTNFTRYKALFEQEDNK